MQVEWRESAGASYAFGKSGQYALSARANGMWGLTIPSWRYPCPGMRPGDSPLAYFEIWAFGPYHSGASGKVDGGLAAAKDAAEQCMRSMASGATDARAEGGAEAGPSIPVGICAEPDPAAAAAVESEMGWQRRRAVAARRTPAPTGAEVW